MNPKQIEEAVAWFEKEMPVIDFSPEERIINERMSAKYIEILINLAQLYLQASEALPKKKEVCEDSNHPFIHIQEKNGFRCVDNTRNKGFNQCHDEFVLWLMKRLEGVETLLKSFEYIDITNSGTSGKEDKYIENVKDLAQAIREFILGGEK